MAKKKARRKKVESPTPGRVVKPEENKGAGAPQAAGAPASGSPPPKVEWSRLAFPLILMVISLAILIRGAFVGKSEQTRASAGTGVPTNVVLPEKGFQTLSPGVWYAALQKADPADTVILDVRTAGEVSSGKIHPEGYEFLNLDYYDSTFEQQLNRLDKNKTYFVYCSSGFRSGVTIQRMETLGFKRVFNLSGGLAEYRRAGLPLSAGP